MERFDLCFFRSSKDYCQKIHRNSQNFILFWFQWVTLFDDSARNLVGLEARDLRSLFDQDPDVFRRKLHGVKYSMFDFVAKTKCEKYNDETRIKMTILSAAPITLHSDQRRVSRLKEEIKSMKDQLQTNGHR